MEFKLLMLYLLSKSRRGLNLLEMVHVHIEEAGYEGRKDVIRNIDFSIKPGNWLEL